MHAGRRFTFREVMYWTRRDIFFYSLVGAVPTALYQWLGWTWFCLRNHGFGALVPFFIDWGDSAHPAKSAPRGGRLVSVEAFSPDARGLESIYRVLGLEIPVAQRAAPGLAVTIESSRGRNTLRMFEPAPRGYVI